MDLSHLNLRVSDPAACRSFYERHFGFRLAFEAEGGYFLRNDEGFLLALVPVEVHQPLPDGFHIGFALPGPDDVAGLHEELAGAGARLTEVEDFRPGEAYVTFRCWDPDGTEIEVFWDDARPPATPERPPSTASTTTPPG
jgi:catechol 2,3-dioxygenase-like lactoylglutathione lyase family enzyme